MVVVSSFRELFSTAKIKQEPEGFKTTIKEAFAFKMSLT